MKDGSRTVELDALLRLAGLTVNDKELRQLKILHGRLGSDRDRLRQLVLGENEPAVIFVPDIKTNSR